MADLSPDLQSLLDRVAEGATRACGADDATVWVVENDAIHQVAHYGIHPRILDGSGLSRDDRSSPNQVLTLLRGIWGTPIGHVLLPSLPVLGVNGTTRRIGKNTAAQGRCIGKTGTLDNVTNLAGYCHARGGHMVAYALFLDGPSNEQSIQMLGPVVGAIAKY